MGDKATSPTPTSPDRKRALEEVEDTQQEDSRKRQALDLEAEETPDYSQSPEALAEPAFFLSHQPFDEFETIETPVDNTVVETNAGEAKRDDPNAAGPNPEQQVTRRSRETLGLRALISTQEAGLIIGKHGKNVSDIRTTSGARVTVSETIPQALDRIVTVRGFEKNLADAFGMIAAKKVQESELHRMFPPSVAHDIGNANIRLLIPDSAMGWVIGKRGQKIRAIHDQSRVKLQPNDGPLPGSTERVLNLFGTPEGIKIAVYEIASVLLLFINRPDDKAQEKPEVKLYRPLPGVASAGLAGPAQRMVAPAMGMTAPGMPLPMPMQMPMMSGPFPPGPGGMAPSPGFPPMMMPMPMAGGAALPGMGAPSVSQQIYIPSSLAGALIGRKGSAINEIRRVTGCEIRISDPERGNHARGERLLTVSGPPQGCQMAVGLLWARLEENRDRMARGVPNGYNR
ncbi:hypothetical protein BC832DRAFT_527247 [Gaertneriomyces semiglobifer]|nr:hypothetical protein BC832DRAFT_527247 [Gaertneriomyces semiglobifer]